jgi:hypothetical protein
MISTWAVGSIPPAGTNDLKELSFDFFVPRNRRVTFSGNRTHFYCPSAVSEVVWKGALLVSKSMTMHSENFFFSRTLAIAEVCHRVKFADQTSNPYKDFRPISHPGRYPTCELHP